MQSVIETIRTGWEAKTSLDAEWNESNPAKGQGAASSLIIQDHFGGDIIGAVISEETHYWNKTMSRLVVDVSKDQFEEFNLDTQPAPVDREIIMQLPGVTDAYLTLCRNCNYQPHIR